jgi:hypothetical protein
VSGARREDGGQATVELALVLPLVAVLALGVIQVGIVGYRQVLVVHAAREGARAAAVAEHDRAGAAREGVDRAGGLDTDQLVIGVEDDGRRVTVGVRYRDETDVPIIGLLLPAIDLEGAATMLVEAP